MSAALVRKSLEISEDDKGDFVRKVQNSGKRKLKSIEKKKKAKLSPEQVLKRNLKVLKALEFSSRSKEHAATQAKQAQGQGPAPIKAKAVLSSKKKGKKNKNKEEPEEEESGFTEEDFRKFEQEYFVY